MYRPLVLFFYKLMAVVLSLVTSWGISPAVSTQTPIIIDDTAELTFVALGDCQVSNVMYQREMHFFSAMEDIGNTQGKFDALIIAGDIAENGLESEYATVSDILNAKSDKYENFLALEGNHDVRFRAFDSQLRRFQKFNESVEKSVPMESGKYNYSYEINGYKFVVLGTDKTVFEESYFSSEQLSWLDSEIASTKAIGKPVFVFAHQPLQNTHGLPSTWQAPKAFKAGSIGKQTDELRSIFEKYNNVIFISGHLHLGIGEYSFEDFGSFKSINLPTVSANNADGIENDGQGYIFSVYKDKIIARGRIFAEGKYVDESIKNAVIEIPIDF